MDNFTQPAGRTPDSVARPPLDDAAAQSGKPPKAIKTQIHQMQPLSRSILYRAVHYKECSGCLPHDLMNMAVDDVLNRVTEAKVLEQIIQELQGVYPGMLADRSWLVLATYELWTGDELRATERLLETGVADDC